MLVSRLKPIRLNTAEVRRDSPSRLPAAHSNSNSNSNYIEREKKEKRKEKFLYGLIGYRVGGKMEIEN